MQCMPIVATCARELMRTAMAKRSSDAYMLDVQAKRSKVDHVAVSDRQVGHYRLFASMRHHVTRSDWI